MKIALITDTHFGARNDNLNFNEYFYQFYEGVFFPYLQQNNIKTCIHLGDCFDRRKYVSYRTAKDFRERFIIPFNTLGIDLHMLVGNHDIYYKNISDVNSLTELIGTKHNNIHIYEDATEVDFDGLPILLMPWITQANELYAEGMIDETKADICLGHLEINGFQMNKNVIISQGGKDKEFFRKFDTVMSGHFHHKSDDGQIYYLGTPYEIYWNDWEDPKGFHIYDTETRELERIVNPYSIYEKIYYDDTKENYLEHDTSKYANKYVKLIVVNKKDLYQFDQFLDKMYTADAYDIKIVEDFSDLDASSVSDDIVENTEDTVTLLNKYIDDLSIDLSKDRLKNQMKSLYTEAQDLDLE